MHASPPENPIEDHIIEALDKGRSPAWKALEMDKIRAEMRRMERQKYEELKAKS